MKNLIFLISIFFFAPNLHAQKSLFNGKNLKNWEIFLGSPVPGFEELAKSATKESTYQVIQLDGKKVIRVSGEINASLATKAEYGNYHLHLEFKWGERVYGKRNSGLLYHSFGPFGAAFGTWMATIEHTVKNEMQRISQRLTGRIKELAERYQTPMPKLIEEVNQWEEKVNAHLAKMGLVWK